MAEQNDTLEAVMADTTAHYYLMKPIYLNVVDALRSGRIVDETYITEIASVIRPLIPNNENLMKRTDRFRDMINRNADPEEIRALNALDGTLNRGNNSLKAITKICEGVGALLNMQGFFNNSLLRIRNSQRITSGKVKSKEIGKIMSRKNPGAKHGKAKKQ